MVNKRVVVTETGGHEVLKLIQEPIPQPGAKMARIKIIVTGVAFGDVLMREGVYPNMPALPFTPGYDIVGIIDAVGTGVESVKVGQMVAALTIHGGYSQYICLPEEELVQVPKGVKPEEAVCLVLNYVTSFQMLRRIISLHHGDRVLIHGAAGGVGSAMLELGKRIGLKMYGTASSQKLKVIQNYSAIPIDYQLEDFVERIHSLTSDGVDAVFDSIGGAHWYRSFQTLRRGGAFIGYGFSAVLGSHKGEKEDLEVMRLWKQIAETKMTLDGNPAYLYSVTKLKNEKPEWFKEDLSCLLDMLYRGEIKPVISEQLSLTDAVRAHQLFESGTKAGKIIMICN